MGYETKYIRKPIKNIKEIPKEGIHSIVKEKEEKRGVTIYAPLALMERIRNAVYWEPGLTLTYFYEQALSKAIDKLEKVNNGPYQDRNGKLKNKLKVRGVFL